MKKLLSICVLLLAVTCVRAQVVTRVVAGTGTRGYSGDGGPATAAQFNAAYGLGIYVDAGNNIYISDFENNRVRRVTPDGVVNTFAGTGISGGSGDGGKPPQLVWLAQTVFGQTARVTSSSQNRMDKELGKSRQPELSVDLLALGQVGQLEMAERRLLQPFGIQGRL